MTNLSIVQDGEMMVAQVEAQSQRGQMFLDAYCPDHEFTVIDSGRIIVPQAHLPELLGEAGERRLEAEGTD